MSRKPTTDNKLNSIEKENLAPTFSTAPIQEMNLTMKEYNNLQREIIFYDNYYSIID